MLIVGGGPCGLMLSNELGRRGVSAIMIDDKPGTAFNPQGRLSPGKMLPTAGACGMEQKHPGRRAAL